MAPPRTPDTAEAALTDAAENGLINDAQRRKMQQDIDADRAAGLARMNDLAEARYADAQRFGEPALEGFRSLSTDADALADELAHGLDPAEGRRRFEALLIRQTAAIAQEDRFQAAAITVVEVDEDPAAANEAFLNANPAARQDYPW